MTRTVRFALPFCLALLLHGDLLRAATGTWTPAASLSAARAGAATVLLQDGRLLVTGGDSGSGAVASVDIIDTAGNVSQAAAMNSARCQHTATVLQDGRVLVAGGTTTTVGGLITNAAELYDPSANTWIIVGGGMALPRAGETATLLKDGTVLIAGGQSTGGPTDTLEIFSPTANSFSALSVILSSPREQHAAVLLQDGRALIAGGSNGSVALNSVDIYDPAGAGTVSSAGAMTAPRAALSATTLLDGTVLLAGGNNGSADLASAEIYSPSGPTFTLTGNLITARSGHLAFLLPNNNEVLIVGGTSNGTALASTELFAPWNGVFTATSGALGTARTEASGSPLQQNGQLMVAGGSNGTNPLASAETFGFATVTTDKSDYPPGTTVNISGSGWVPGETVTLTLVESPFYDTHGPFSAVADSDGNISNSSFTTDLHDAKVRFSLTAVGSVSQAQNTFTDSVNIGSVTVGSQSPNPVPAGTSATYTVTVNIVGNGAGGTCTATLSASGFPSAVSSYSFTPASVSGSKGDSPTSTLTVYTSAGTSANSTFTVTATGGTSCGGGSQTANPNPTLVVVGPATQLKFLQQPTSAVAGASISPAVTVQVLDASGNVVTSSTAAITLAIGANAGGGTLSGTATVNAVNGVATFSNLSINKTGTGYTLSASSTGLTAATSSAFNITAGAATQLAFSQQPTNTASGSSISAIKVQIEDANGNVVTSSTASITLAIGTNPSGGTLSGTATVSAVSGVATFSNLSINKTGNGYTLTASSTGLTVATSSAFNITAGTATKLVFGQQPTNTAAGASISPAVTVQIEDANGNVVTGSTASITIAIGTNPSGGTLSGTATVNAVSGVATFSNLSINKTGNGYTLSASGTGLTGATSSGFNVTPGAATTLVVTGFPTPIGAGTAENFTVTVKDAQGNTATGYTGTVHFTSSDPAATLPANYTFVAADNGIHTFSATLNTAGTQSITATDTVTGSITGAQNGIQVNTRTTTTSISPLTGTGVIGGTALFSVTVADVNSGGTVSTPAGTISLADTSSPNNSDTFTTCTLSQGSNPVGTASCQVTVTITAPAGTHNISASFTATDHVHANGTTTQNAALTVSNPATTTQVQSSLTPSTFGQAVTFTATVTSASGTPTGSVTFYDGGSCAAPGSTLAPAVSLNAGGAASFGTSALTAGSHTILACYNPTGIFNPSNGSTAQQVGQATAVITWANPADIVYGTALSTTQLNATANVPGAFVYNPPAGTVLGVGSAQVLSVSFTPTDTTDYAGAAKSVSINVNQATPTVTSSGPGTSTYGTGVTLSVTLTPPAGAETPTGTVQFQFTDSVNSTLYNVCTDGSLQAQPPAAGSTPCAIPLSNGTASVTTSSLPAGTSADAVTATYNPSDPNYAGGSTTINYTVGMASTQATLGITPATGATYGDTVTLASTVSDGTTGSTGTPTGTVQFEYSTDNNATWINIGEPVTLDATGNAQTTTSTLPAGTPSIKAVYSGDSNFTASSSGATGYALKQKCLTVSGITAAGKPYDGTTTATLDTSNAQLVGLVASDPVQLVTSGASGTFGDPNVGTAKTVTVAGLSLSGTAASNYTLKQPTATASITAVTVAVTAPSLTVTYGDPVPSPLTPTYNAFVNGEGVGALSTAPTCTTTYTPASAAGSGQTTSCTGAAAVNYVFTYVSGTVTVNKANATIKVTPYNVTYDGNAHTATGTATGVKGETLAGLNLSGTAHTNAGTYGSDAWSFTDTTGNYSSTGGTVSDSIAKANATITVTPYNVTYDGNAHTATGTATGVKGETLAGLNLSGTAHTNAGTYSTDAWSFTDTTGNYNPAAGTVADAISQAVPSLPPAQTGTSTYGTGVTLSVTLTPPAGAETPTGTVQFQFTDSVNSTLYNVCTDGSLQAQPPAAGSTPCAIQLTNGTASVTTSSLPAGTSADAVTATYNPSDPNYAGGSTTINYTVGMASTQATLGITPATGATYGDTVTLASTVSDGTTGSTGTPTGTVQFEYSTDNNATWINIGEPVTLDATGNAQTTTSTLPAGTPSIKAVYSGDSNFTASSSGATGYALKQKCLTVSGITAAGKPYDGTTTATLDTSNAQLVGLVASDPVQLVTSGASGTFGDPNVGTAKTVTVAGLSLSGTAASNYTLKQPTATASITAVTVAVTAPSLTVTYGDPVPSPLTPTYNAFVNGEGVGALSTAPTCTTTYTPASAAGSGQTTSCTGAVAVNYVFTYVSGTVTVNKANATIKVTPYNVTYDGNAHTATGTATGVKGETLAGLNLSGTAHTNAGTYGSDAWSFTDTTGNYSSTGGTVSDSIAKANATITVTPYNVTYDGNAHTATGTAMGVKGETLAGLNLSGTTHTNAGTYGSDAWTFTDTTGNYNPANGTVSDSIAKAPLTITASSPPVYYGQPVPLIGPGYSAFANGDSPASLPIPPICSTTAAQGSPVASYLSTCSGPAVDGNYAITYASGSVTVAPASTTTAVVSSSLNNTSTYMQLVTFTATVADNTPGSSGTPTGTVTFYNNGTSIGTGTLSAASCGTPPCPDQATLSIASLPDTSADNITAVYSGDGNFTGSNNNASALVQTVQPAPNVSLSPLSVSFGNQNLNTTGTGPTITLKNTGDAPLNFAISITGSNANEFAIPTKTNTCGSTLAAGASCTITVTYTPTQTGSATASLQITDNDDDATNAQQIVALTGSGLSTITGNSLYTEAIFATANGCGSIVMSGGSTVDSFNSAQGYASSHVLSGGNVGTNGNVTLNGGKSAIYGSAAVDFTSTGNCSKTSQTGITSSGGAQVTGGPVALNGPVNYPAPPPPNPAPPITNQNISGSCGSIAGCSNDGSKAVILAPGQYGNLNVSGGTTAHFSQGTYNINSLTLSGGSILYVDSGPVIVNLAGASLSGGNPALDASGGSMENPTHIPANLQFTYSGSQSVNLTGGSASYATVYAPSAIVNMSGGTDFFGSIVGSTVTSSGGTAIHYDTNLPNIAAGSYIWLTAVVNKVSNLPASQVKLYMTNSTVTVNGTTYNVPNGVVTFNSAAQTSGATTSYDLTNSRWSTAVATSGLTGNTFIAGVAVPVPQGGFSGGIQNVTWSAAFSTDTPGITLQWQWGAAVYSSFSGTYATGATSTTSNVLGVNAEDGSADAHGTDPAGTPETYKQYETFGGTLGYLSAGSGVVPTIAPMSVSPSSLSFPAQSQGTTTAIPLTATLTNNDSNSHAFNGAGIQVMGTNAGDFTLVTGGANNCLSAASLASGASCTLYVSFKPSESGAETAKIVLNDDANNSPQTVYLTGTGQ